MINTNRYLSPLMLTVLLVQLPSTVFAEAAIEETIVTAQKREQSLQDVPLSVTAVSGERLAALTRCAPGHLSEPATSCCSLHGSAAQPGLA